MTSLDNVNQLIEEGKLRAALTEIKKLIDTSPKWEYLTKELTILRELGNIDGSLERIRKLERDQTHTFLQKFDLDMEKLYCFWAKFEIETAVEFSKILAGSVEDLYNYEKNEYQPRLAKYNHLQGIIYSETGQYIKAIEAHQEALRLYKILKRPERVALMLNNYGFVHSLLGNTKLAENALYDGLQLYENHGKLQDKARILNNLGIVKSQKEEFDEARSYFMKSLKLQREIENPIEISYSLLEIVKLHLITKTDPSDTLNSLRELSYGSSEPIIRLRYQLAKAIVLKSINRFKSKVEAQQLLEAIAWDSHAPQRYSVFALKHLAEIKFDELQTYGDETILNEIQELVDLQLKLVKLQGSVASEIEAKLLCSKLELLRGEIELSLSTVEECLYLAQKVGLVYLEKLATDFSDQLISQMSYWQETKYLEDLGQRLEKVEIFSFLRNIQYDNIGHLKIDKEIPVLFMVMTQSGSVKANIRFGDVDILNEQMIGTFISAINAFFNEAFVTGNSIERINSNDYTLLLKPEYGLTYVYIFKGQSYYATRKLRNVITQLKIMNSYQEFVLKKGITTPISLQLNRTEIDKLKHIFLH